MRKRILSFILVLVMMLTMIPVLDLHASALHTKITDRNSVAGANYTKNINLAKKLDSVFDGNANIYSDKGCTKLVDAKIGTNNLKDNGVFMYVGPYGGKAINSGTSCWIYANGVYYTLFGECTGNGSPGKNSVSLDLSNTPTRNITYDNFKTWGVRQGVGALIRTSTHSMIVLHYDKDTLTILEGNGDGNGLVDIRVRSWDEIHYTTSYIIQPKDTYYNSLYPNCDCAKNYNNVGICSKCGNEFNFMATKDTGAAGVYETTKKITPRTDKPYAASTNEAKQAIPKGEKVTVEYSVKNHYTDYDHIWYYVTYKDIKGYIYSDNLKFKKHFDQKITCTITSPTENQSLTKKAHPLIGTVTSTYPIAIINGYLDGQHFVDTKPNATTVDLRSSVINTCLDFGKLSPGKHTLELKAHDIHRKDDISIIKRTFYIEAIGPHTCDKGEYLWVWDLHPHYKCYKCSICGEEWANKSEPTVREGCSDCYPPTCKVSLNTNGGSCDKKELIVTDGSNIGDLPTPTLSGYAFDGWYTEPFSGSKVSSSTKVTGDMTVYAHWKHDGSKLNFNFNGGTYEGAAVTAQLTSVNNGRPGGALVVFNESGTTVNTNVYGWEIAVGSNGEVQAVRKYGDSAQLQVPNGGFVLSGQADSTPGVEGIFGGVLTVIDIYEKNLNYVYVDYETGKVYAYDNRTDYIASHKYVRNGSDYENLPIPARDGYYFWGWKIEGKDQLADYNSTYLGSNLTALWRTLEEMSPSVVEVYNGKTYEVYDYPMSWYQAQAVCEAKGGHLVTITSSGEQQFVADMAYFTSPNFYFIGCTDESEEGKWTWVTGEAFDYNNWGSGEPNGGTWENYGLMITTENNYGLEVYSWNDNAPEFYGSLTDTFWDMSSAGFICEYEPSSCEHEIVWLELITEPSLTATGEMYQDCWYCDMEGNFTLPALNKFDYELSTVSPACETPGKDKYTLYYKGYNWPFEVEIPATGHKWDSGVITNAATCEVDGVKTYTCQNDKAHTKTETIPAVGHKDSDSDYICDTCNKMLCTNHSAVTIASKAATCTEAGLTDGEKCSKCGKVLTEQEVIPALGHNPELKNEKAATCTTDGYTGDEICKTCGKTIKSGDVIKATDHKWDEGKVTKEPNETTEGIKQFTCTVCKETKEESIPVTTHKHTFKNTVVAPSCTEGGYTLHECKCGESFKDSFTDALGHSPELKNAKAATCTTDGYTGDEICKTCDKTIKSGEAIKAKGHSYANGKCSVCGAADPGYKDPTPAPADNPFKDVKESDWFYSPVLWAVQNNVTGGTSPNTFGPNNFCTRAQVVTFLWAANGKPEPTSMNNPFTDVSDNAWYCKAVMWAVEQGITGGTSATTFSPDAYCTRAQVATFLYAAQGKPAVQNANNEFIDVPNNAWYLNPVLWAAENGITGGIGGGKFGPDQTCTRAQIATFLYKAMS